MRIRFTFDFERKRPEERDDETEYVPGALIEMAGPRAVGFAMPCEMPPEPLYRRGAK